MKQEEIEIKQYIALKRWDATLRGEEYVVKTCPYCEKSDNSFYISAKTGQFRCMRASCGKTGNLLTLKKDLGDLKQSKPKEDASKFISSDLIEKRHNRLKNKPEYLDKLYARGITDEAIDFFRLGFCNLDINGTSTPFLCIPHLVNGVAKNVKYRILLDDDTYNKADKWRREEGLASVLFNADVLRMSPKRVVLVESELDAISVWCAGEKNVVGLTCGADTFKPEWYDLFDGIEEIIGGLDADIAGFNGAKKIARRLGFNRTKYVTWPMKDPNKVLTDMGPEAIMYALSRPEGFEVTGVRTFSQALQRRFSNVGEGSTGIYTPWPSVNKKLGKRGFQEGDLVVLSAPYKTGKCFGRDTKIMMSDGSVKNVQDVQQGEYVMGPDSRPRLVLNTTSGVGELYKVSPKYGSPWVCNKDHILYVKSMMQSTKFNYGQYYKMTPPEFIALTKYEKMYMRLERVAVSYTSKEVPYDPYIVGIWFGDGTTKFPKITTMDQEVVDAIYTLADMDGANVRVSTKPDNRASTYTLYIQNRGTPEFTKFIRTSCMINGYKNIPDLYLKNDEHVRLQLLAGIIDSDGHLGRTGNSYEIATKLPNLRDQYMELARGLGFRTSYIRKVVNGVTYYRVWVSGNLHRIPTRIPRKQAKEKIKNGRTKNPLLTGMRVEHIGVGEFFGFAVDGDNLFLLEDHTVVHNSIWSNQWSLWLAENGFPILQINLEMSVDQLIDTAVKVVRKKTDETIMPIDYLETDVYMKDHPVYYLEDEDGSLSSVDKMFEAMEDAVKRYGIKFIVFDHLHFLVRSLTHTNAEIGIITRRFKSFARQNGVIICLIAQPRKLNGQRPTADDLKDSVSIATDADCIILMYRERVGQDEFDLQDGDEYVEGGPQVIQSPITEIIFAAARFAGSGLARLYFDGETATFYELDGTQPKLGHFYVPEKKQEE